jgi:hypothetical protein
LKKSQKNVCVRFIFKYQILKTRIFVRTFEKGGGAKKGFWFLVFFLIFSKIIKKFPLDLDFFSPPPPPTFFLSPPF